MLDGISKIITSIANLAWPLMALWIAYIFLPVLHSLSLGDNLTVKVGDFEVSLQRATSQQINIISDLQARLALVENSLNLSVSSLASADPGSILWVDDAPSNNAVEISSLQAQGYKVITVTNTNEALRWLSNAPDDLRTVITDLSRLEGGTRNPAAGQQLIREIRNLKVSVPIIVYTSASAATRQGEELRKEGASLVTSSLVELFRELGIRPPEQ